MTNSSTPTPQPEQESVRCTLCGSSLHAVQDHDSAYRANAKNIALLHKGKRDGGPVPANDNFDPRLTTKMPNPDRGATSRNDPQDYHEGDCHPNDPHTLLERMR